MSNLRIESSSRLGAFLARALICLAGGLLGFLVGTLAIDRGVLTGPNNLLYLTVVGLLLAYLLSEAPAKRAGRLWARSLRQIAAIPPETVLAAGAGAVVGLIVTILLSNVMDGVPGFTWYWSLLIALVLVIGSASFFVMNRKVLPILNASGSRPAKADDRPRDKLVDTSAIIDGRIFEVVEANFVDGKLMLPQFVLTELQRIADSDDPLRRQRGRRGLEVLDRLVAHPRVVTEVVKDELPASVPVDDRLVKLCQERGFDLITTDYNLSRVAALQGVRVLNLHQLANAVKASYMPGERLSLSIVKPGRESGQGLAYLEDGTMVVVEEAAEKVGHTLEVVVTSSLQTNMGRMIFARPNGHDQVS